MSKRSAEDPRSNYEVIVEYLSNHKDPTHVSGPMIAEATGRKVYSPELTKARKVLGIKYERTHGPRTSKTLSVGEVISQSPEVKKRGRPRKFNGFTPLFQPKTSDGLYAGVIELAKLHGGISEVLKAANDVASV